MLSKFNAAKKFNVDTSDYEYVTLSELMLGVPYPLDAIFINEKSTYGAHPVFATCDKQLVDIPKHMTDTCREILEDDEAIESINKGCERFEVYTYFSKEYNKQCYNVRFCD